MSQPLPTNMATPPEVGPKYRNGADAKIGDEVVGYDANGNLVAGVIVDLKPTGFVHNCRVLSGKEMAALPFATVEDLQLATDVLKHETAQT